MIRYAADNTTNGEENKLLRIMKLAYVGYPDVQNVPVIYANHVT